MERLLGGVLLLLSSWVTPGQAGRPVSTRLQRAQHGAINQNTGSDLDSWTRECLQALTENSDVTDLFDRSCIRFSGSLEMAQTYVWDTTAPCHSARSWDTAVRTRRAQGAAALQSALHFA